MPRVEPDDEALVDENQADARYENGILELTLPKAGESSRHQLPVHDR